LPPSCGRETCAPFVYRDERRHGPLVEPGKRQDEVCGRLFLGSLLRELKNSPPGLVALLGKGGYQPERTCGLITAPTKTLPVVAEEPP
jgi:hypothetical protein